MNMRIWIIGAFWVILCMPVAVAQNLVPNGSFEDYTICPEFSGYVQYATGWENLHTNSADYFHRCQPNQVVGVPFNTCGYQEPADGDAYVGMATTFPGLSWYREIVGRELMDPLQIGVPVCLSFKVAVGGFGTWNGNSANLTAKGVGLRFFNGFPSDWTEFLYPNDAALALDVVPTDTAIWYAVSGEYIPDSAYTHLAVGNFLADSLSTITTLDSTGYGIAGVSYAFIDDVRVSYDLGYCSATNIAPYYAAHYDVRVHPQPFNGQFNVMLERPAMGNLNWTLWDISGRIVLRGSEWSGTEYFEVVTGLLPSAPYTLQVLDDMGAFAPVRVFSVSP